MIYVLIVPLYAMYNGRDAETPKERRVDRQTDAQTDTETNGQEEGCIVYTLKRNRKVNASRPNTFWKLKNLSFSSTLVRRFPYKYTEFHEIEQ
jgi:hypothetical protein